MRHDWISRRRVLFGVRLRSVRGCFVTGHVWWLYMNSHRLMLSRSYEMPVERVTGSFMICREMGQMKKGGKCSGPSISFLWMNLQQKEEPRKASAQKMTWRRAYVERNKKQEGMRQRCCCWISTLWGQRKWDDDWDQKNIQNSFKTEPFYSVREREWEILLLLGHFSIMVFDLGIWHWFTFGFWRNGLHHIKLYSFFFKGFFFK